MQRREHERRRQGPTSPSVSRAAERPSGIHRRSLVPRTQARPATDDHPGHTAHFVEALARMARVRRKSWRHAPAWPVDDRPIFRLADENEKLTSGVSGLARRRIVCGSQYWFLCAATPREARNWRTRAPAITMLPGTFRVHRHSKSRLFLRFSARPCNRPMEPMAHRERKRSASTDVRRVWISGSRKKSSRDSGYEKCNSYCVTSAKRLIVAAVPDWVSAPGARFQRIVGWGFWHCARFGDWGLVGARRSSLIIFDG
jgi:hypothetical protein